MNNLLSKEHYCCKIYISSVPYINIYLFKVNNGRARKMYEIWSKLMSIKDDFRRSDVFIVNFEEISYSVLVFLFLTLNK